MTDIETAVRDIVSHVAGSLRAGYGLNPSEKLCKAGLDSADVLMIVVHIERKYGIVFPARDISHFFSLRDIVDITNRKLKEKGQ